LQAGNYQFVFNGQELPAGVYYVNVQMNDEVITKMVSLTR
jgi:hypothetical protein